MKHLLAIAVLTFMVAGCVVEPYYPDYPHYHNYPYHYPYNR